MRLSITSIGNDGLRINLRDLGNFLGITLKFASAAEYTAFLCTLASLIPGANAQNCDSNQGDLTGTIFCLFNAEHTVNAALEIGTDVAPAVVNAIKEALIQGICGVIYFTDMGAMCAQLPFAVPIPAGTLGQATSDACSVAQCLAQSAAGFFSQTTTTAGATASSFSSTMAAEASSLTSSFSNSATTQMSLLTATGIGTSTSVTSGQILPTSSPNLLHVIPVWVWCVAGGMVLFLCCVTYLCACRNSDHPKYQNDVEAGSGEAIHLLNAASNSNPARVPVQGRALQPAVRQPVVAPAPAAAANPEPSNDPSSEIDGPVAHKPPAALRR